MTTKLLIYLNIGDQIYRLYLPKQFHKQRPQLQDIGFVLGHEKFLQFWYQFL